MPAIDYRQNIVNRQYATFVTDWIVVLLAGLYLVFTLVDVVKSIRAQRKIYGNPTDEFAIRMTQGTGGFRV